MRLAILNRKYPIGVRILFSIIHLVSRHPLPDAAKITFYRPEYYGDAAKTFTHEAMRGPSSWSVADRELMAAYLSSVNRSPFCVGAHTATATLARGDATVVDSVLSNLHTAPVAEPLKAVLKLLGTLVQTHSVSVDDMRAVLAAGVSREAIEDALAVCAAFDTTNRLADAFDFAQLTPEAYLAGARVLLSRGYR